MHGYPTFEFRMQRGVGQLGQKVQFERVACVCTTRGVESDDAGNAVSAKKHLARFRPSTAGKRERCMDALTVKRLKSAAFER